MDLCTFIIALALLQGVCLWVGGKSAKGLTSQDDYFLASKTVRFFPLMMTFVATQIGGGFILGSAEEAYRYGLAGLCYPVGISLGLVLLGLGAGRKLAEFKVQTIARLLEVVYGSKMLKKVASILSMVSLFMVLIAVIIASHKFMVSLGAGSTLWFTVFWAVVIFYTVNGGLKAVVATDVVQALFFIVVFFASLAYAITASPLLCSDVIAQGVEDMASATVSQIQGGLLMPLLFVIIGQDMGQRCFAAKSPQTVSRATLCAGVCAFCVAVVPVYFGMLAKSLGMAIPSGASVLMVTMEQTTNPVLMALVACAVLAAVVSTADSLINAISSNLAQDFDLAIFSKKESIRTVKIVTAVISVMAIFFSFYSTSIIGIMVQSYELSLSCLFVPICASLFRKKGNFISALLAILCGGVSFCLFQFLAPPFSKEILSILLSFGGYLIGEMIAKPLEKTEVKQV